MADDIRLFVGFPDHPKTIKLIRRAGEGAVRCLLRLWLWTRCNRATTGDLEGLEDEDIEIAAGWTGDDGLFVAALRTCRFLDGHRLHGWEERQEHAVEEDVRSDRAALSAYRRYHSEEEAQALLAKRKEKRSHCGRTANAVRPACSPPSPPSPPSPEEEPPLIPPPTRKRAAQKPAESFVLPEWIPVSEWGAWVEMRTKKRNAPTDRAKELAIKELERLKAVGEDPAAVLNQSTFKGWQGLFAVKENGNGTGGTSTGGDGASSSVVRARPGRAGEPDKYASLYRRDEDV